MAILNTSTWILLFFDVLGVWLVARPSDLINLWTARRIPVSELNRFLLRLFGMFLLSMQVMHWELRAKSSNSGSMTRWFSIAFGVAAVAFLGYHFAGLFTSKLDQRTQVDKANRRYLLPESEGEAKVRYRAAWQKYRRLRVAFPVAFLGWLPFGYLLGAAFRFLNWNGYVAGIMILAWIPLIPIFGWQWSFWQCPRCGYAFKGPHQPFFPKRCHHCQLPIWAESPDD